MHMLRNSFAALAIAMSVVHVSAQYTTYGVTVDVLDVPALTKVATYSYVAAQPAYDKAVDQFVIRAIERELTARGLTKSATAKADVVVTYSSLRRTDVDLKSKPTTLGGTLRQFPVGTLVVSIGERADRQKKLFQGRIDKPMELDPATYEATINSAVAEIFEKYPRKTKTP
jgi:hypothetical protein